VGRLWPAVLPVDSNDRRETRFQIQEIFSYLDGNHSIKLGSDVQRITSTFIDLSDVSGTWDFDSAGEFSGKPAQPFPAKTF